MKTMRTGRLHHVLPEGLPPYVHARKSPNTEGTHTFLFLGGKKPSPQGGPLMAGKKKRCPYLARRKKGKWTELACSLPAGGACPDPRCMARPDADAHPDTDLRETVPDGGE